MKKSLIIDGNNLKAEDVYNVAKNDITVEFPDGDEFKKQISASREYLESFIKKGYPVYGVTTGFGILATIRLTMKTPRNFKNLS